jgi:trk system potassium uptake protein TrkH
VSQGRPNSDNPFLPASFEFTATVVGGLALIAILLRDGYQLPLSAGLLQLIEWVEWAAVAVLLARLPGRVLARRLRRRTWLGWGFDLILGALAVTALLYGQLSVAAALAVGRQAIVTIRMLPRWGRVRGLLVHLQTRPGRVLAISFLFTILAGALLLTLPAATADGRGAPLLTALFTATSAVCVTGLVVVDTGSYFSRFGHWVILALIQAGGLGIMTLSISVFLLFRRRLGLRTRSVMQHLKHETSVQSLVSLVRYIIGTTILIESIGLTVLWFCWRDLVTAPGERFFVSLFHSISAFCNAGFTLFPDSLAGPAGANPIILMTVAVLIVIGGLGFTVIATILDRDLIRRGPRRSFHRLNTQTRLVLVVSGLLLVAGTGAIFFLEFHRSLATMPAGEKLLTAFFHSVTARTAGFHRVNMVEMLPVTLLLTIMLMFIGAAPGSTGGGIKVTTLGVLVLSVRAMLKEREDVEIAGRTIPKSTVYRAIAITVISFSVVTGSLLVLIATQRGSFEVLVFETISAFANVGLSLGATSELDGAGRLLLILLMFIGRIGPLTLTLAIGEKFRRVEYRYPEARLMVG